jgi:hypothetical protein
LPHSAPVATVPIRPTRKVSSRAYKLTTFLELFSSSSDTFSSPHAELVCRGISVMLSRSTGPLQISPSNALTPRQQERGSTETGFLCRVAGTTPLLLTRFGSESERGANGAVHPFVHHWVHSSEDASHTQPGVWTRRQDEFVRGQDTELGWSDPTSLPRKPWRSLQPNSDSR